MKPAAHRNEDNASAPVLYMALELSDGSWRLTFGGGGKRRQVSVPAGDLMKLSEAVAKAKEHFGMPAAAPVVSCYEAGRDGFWLHRHLKSVGIQNEAIDAASIEVSRRLRHVKTDRLDGERLLDKLMRHHAGEHCGWSVVRVPSIEEEDARHLHRELERLKRGLPRDIVLRLNNALNKVSARPEMAKSYGAFTMVPVRGRSEDMDDRIRSGLEFWGAMIKKLGIKPEA